MQHDRDQFHSPTLSRGRQTIPGGRGIAGLEAGRAVVEADKLVGVGQAELAVAHGVHPDGRILLDLLVLQKRTGHEGDIIGRRQMRVRVRPIVQPGAVDKMRVRHAKLGCTVVHARNEGGLAARHVLGQCAGAVVRRRDDDGFEHLPERQLLVFLKIDLAAALGGCRGGGRDGVVPANGTVVQRFHHQQQRHDLRNAGRTELFVRVFFIEDLPRVLLHQDARRCGQRQILRLRRQAQSHCENKRKRDAEQLLFHRKTPFRFICTSI